jgi:hypothetical protein
MKALSIVDVGCNFSNVTPYQGSDTLPAIRKRLVSWAQEPI